MKESLKTRLVRLLVANYCIQGEYVRLLTADAVPGDEGRIPHQCPLLLCSRVLPRQLIAAPNLQRDGARTSQPDFGTILRSTDAPYWPRRK